MAEQSAPDIESLVERLRAKITCRDGTMLPDDYTPFSPRAIDYRQAASALEEVRRDRDRANDLCRRMFKVYALALQGHPTQPLKPMQRVQEIRLATCDQAELAYLRELRQAAIDAGSLARSALKG